LIFRLTHTATGVEQSKESEDKSESYHLISFTVNKRNPGGYGLSATLQSKDINNYFSKVKTLACDTISTGF
jgi:hypothetical protein